MKKRLCLAYIIGADTPDKNLDEKLKQIDFKKLTHICIAFSLIRENNGEWLPYVTDEVAGGIHKIKAEIERQGADIKILLSVGGAGADGFCMAARSAQSRRRFTRELMDIINSYDLDGVDIDWEFPGESAFGIHSCDHCKSDFVLLLEELKGALNKRLLTIAVGSNRYFGLAVKRIGEIVDYVFVMNYDLGLMQSNIFLSKTFVTMWRWLGIPKNKVCIGVPLYGRNVKKLSESVAYYEAAQGKITHYLGQSFSKYHGKTYCFDTEKDVERKARWANQNSLGGVFCWEISCDDHNRILNAMSRGINGSI